MGGRGLFDLSLLPLVSYLLLALICPQNLLHLSLVSQHALLGSWSSRQFKRCVHPGRVHPWRPKETVWSPFPSSVPPSTPTYRARTSL